MSETLGKNQKVLRKRVLHDSGESDEQKSNDLLDTEIKEETLYCLDAVKDEPLDEEFVEQNVPKPEEFIASCQAPNSAVSIQQEVFNDLEHYRCPVCLQVQSWRNVKLVTIEEDKLVIMVGFILRDKYSYDQALSFLSNKERMFICHAHFSEVMDDIIKHLNIKHTYEIASCCDHLMTILMNIADRLSPPPKYFGAKWPFRKSVRNFFRRNRSLFCKVLLPRVDVNDQRPKELLGIKVKEEQLDESSTSHSSFQNVYLDNSQQIIFNDDSSNNYDLRSTEHNIIREKNFVPGYSDVKLEPIHSSDDINNFNEITSRNPVDMGKQKSKTTLHFCPICFLMEDQKKTKSVTMEDEKVVIIVGCILRGTHTVDQAHSLISKRTLYICHVHFYEVLNFFCNFLHIKSPVDIDYCSPDLIRNVISIDERVRPRMTVPFQMIFKQFFWRNRRNIFQKFMSSQTELEEQKQGKKRRRNVYNEYIEEEVDDCSENVKEKLLNERFSCRLPSTSLLTSQFVCRTPQMELKETKPEDMLQKEIKQESDYSMIKVKEELLDEDHYEQDTREDASITKASFVNVKSEPIEDVNDDSGICASSIFIN